MIKLYTKIAFRNLLKYKAQSIISVLGLTIGFSAFVLGGYWYYWEHSFDTFHPDWKHTYALTTSGFYKTAEGKDAEVHQLHKHAEDYFDTFPEIEEKCKTDFVSYRPDGKEQQWGGLVADAAFFKMFRCKLLEGTYQGNAYDRKSVILTQKTARQLFGDTPCVGEEFRINKDISFTVAGVMEDYPQNTEFKFDYILLAPVSSNNQNRTAIYVRVNPHANINKLREKIETYRLDMEDAEFTIYSNWHSHLRTLPELHLYCSPGLEARFRNITILACAGLLAFISALMNLLVVFIGQQQRKVRNNLTFNTMGASFRSMAGKSLLELILPLCMAFVLSLAFIEIIFPHYQQYTRLEGYGYYSNYINTIARKDVFGISIVLYLLSSICFLLISLFPITALLKRKKQGVSVFFRNSLIGGQIFIGSLFLVASLGFYYQFRYMTRTDKGIVLDNIWQIDLGFDAVYQKDCRPFGQTLSSNPYIEDVTALSIPVLSSRGEHYCSYLSNLMIDGREEDITNRDNCVAVEPNFLSFFGLKMKEGEWITGQGAPDYVINETGVRILGIDSITNRPIRFKYDKESSYRVSGVMADYHYCPMQYSIDKTFFISLSGTMENDMYMRNQYYYIKVLPQNKDKALEYARTLYEEYDKGDIDPAKQFIYLPDLMDEFNRPEKTMFRIFSALAAICILISAFGIYSLVSLSAEQRRKEIAIRKVNGAVYKDILSLFLKEYFILVVLANAIALPLGYLFISRWLETYAYRTELTIWFFVSVFLITCAVVVASVARQVTFAVKVNPAEIVKSE